VDISFVLSFLESMLTFFNEMRSVGVNHGDLHAGNVLVQKREFDLQGPKYAFRVADFGVASATSGARFKGDYDQLAAMLRELLEQVPFQKLSAHDQYLFNVLNDEFVGRHLVEHDATRDSTARNPITLYQELISLDSRYNALQTDLSMQMLTPFDYLSCEQIAKNYSLLKSLYSNRFLELGEIESRNNHVVTGPRGCGKSTVFRSLSMRYRVLSGSDAELGAGDEDRLKYLGVYFWCNDLYFAFPNYKAGTSEAPQAANLPMHFVTATLLSEALESIGLWAQEYYEEEFARHEESAARAIWDVLGIAPPQSPGANSFRAIAARLQQEAQRAVKKQQLAHDPKQEWKSSYFGPDVLIRACDKLLERLPFLNNRPFYFFIDDYSSPKITQDLQLNLNRLFMQRSHSCFFKLSTESSVSYSQGDSDGKAYVESREYKLVNLGLVYIHASDEEKLEFIEDIFKRRLAAVAGYPASSLEELVGQSSSQSFNEAAREIRESGKKPKFYGKESLARSCSGDIHYVLQVVSEMVSAAGGPEALADTTDVPKISTSNQNHAIREYAGNFLRNLQGSSKHGQSMVNVVAAFGTVAHSYLKYRDSRNERATTPHQACRIEPFDSFDLKSIIDLM